MCDGVFVFFFDGRVFFKFLKLFLRVAAIKVSFYILSILFTWYWSNFDCWVCLWLKLSCRFWLRNAETFDFVEQFDNIICAVCSRIRKLNISYTRYIIGHVNYHDINSLSDHFHDIRIPETQILLTSKLIPCFLFFIIFYSAPQLAEFCILICHTENPGQLQNTLRSKSFSKLGWKPIYSLIQIFSDFFFFRFVVYENHTRCQILKLVVSFHIFFPKLCQPIVSFCFGVV